MYDSNKIKIQYRFDIFLLGNSPLEPRYNVVRNLGYYIEMASLGVASLLSSQLINSIKLLDFK